MVRMLAPSTAGMDSRKENRTENFRRNPRIMPAEMVVPDRDRPGTTATAWPTPTSRASNSVADLAPFFPRAMRSEKNRSRPVTSRAQPTKMVLLYRLSTWSLMGRMTKRGRVATIIITTIRSLGVKRWPDCRFSFETRRCTRCTSALRSFTMSFQ